MKILVVDDSGMVRETVAAVLRSGGHQVRVACHGEEGLAALAQEPADLILADILMPVMDGFQFCRKCKEHPEWQKIPFIFLTGEFATPQDLALARTLGVNIVLTKPLSIDRLLTTVQAAQNGGRARSVHLSAGAGAAPGHGETLYQQRIIAKLEEKVAALEREVAHRQELEARLAAANTRWQKTFDTVEDMVWLLNADRRVICANQATVAVLGRSPAEVVGRHCCEQIHGTTEPVAECPVTRAAQSRHRESLELALGDRWFEVIADPVCGDQGDITGMVHLVRDVTSRHRADAEIRALLESVSEERNRLSALVNSMTDEVWFIDREGRFILANPAARREFRLPATAPTELNHLTGVLDIRRPDGTPRPPEEAPLQRALRGQVVEDEEELVLTPYRGEFRHRLVSSSPVRNQRFEIIGAVSVVRDITARKRQELALQESERFVRNIIDALTAHLAVLDEHGVILAVNRAWREFAATQAPGRDGLCEGADYVAVCRAVRGPDEPMASQFLAGLQAVMRGEMPVFTLEYPCHSPKERRWFVARVSRFQGPGPLRVVVTHENVTSRHLAEEEQMRLQSQLAQSQKMESIGRLAGGVAHDFNNMLGVILGHVELARELAEPTHPLQEALGEIQAAAQRSAELTRQLLAFARRQTVSPRRIVLNEAIAGILPMITRLIGENIRLEWRPGPDLHPIFIDPSQIDQILTNFAANARDAIADQGRIIIETRNVGLDAEAVRDLPDLSPGDHVMLRFQDDGAGMSPEVLEHIFEPFFTTKGLGQGTGLGLATVYGIVKQSRGAIQVESQPGRGTQFRIFWPRDAMAAAPAAIDARPSTTLAPGTAALILLVEDEPAILRVTQRMLEQLGYRVLATSSPSEAVRLAEAHPGQISLLLTDLVMPDQSGQDLARLVSPTQPGLKCLFMSGYFDGDSVRHRVQGQDVRFLQKPFTMSELAAQLRFALGG
ncbi:MAG: diguanylate cyclase/phosphodiesterase (GGDEF & EAL domains) with PAS/PAC sensor(s) [Candidatus Ozemobacter sibiricus]|uniref:histidine kinase n=1 Tax=Candidatus Ozemobacter sibiricus TaxID=2268124 RepID=A0A367ZUG7_9BACT|nr:MAG: diguanylate cyclase/phosphodiesterase (GGDEF & EAL domains) with PAS/PAC sensor(s) [Candidatus Ozemobacter sibiricus]